jgi:hypothetical protein
LGEGRLYRRKEKWKLRASYDSEGSALSIPFALDGFVGSDGRALQGIPQGTRPFNGEEIGQILFLGICIGCHDRYDDGIYRDFCEAERRFRNDEDLPCKK